MLRFECDHPELTKALARLGTDVSKSGAYFSDKLVLRAMDGDLSFTSSVPGGEQELLMSIPEKAFIPYDGVEFKLAGNHLEIASGAENLSPNILDRLETMLTIYNLTNKIEKYKKSSPRVVFKDDPEFLKRLVEGRAGTNIAENTLEILTTDDQDKVIISSFLKTRNFAFGESKQKIIPFIDFTNHHTRARPFSRTKDKNGNLVMGLNNYKPVQGSDQCFARYGIWDSYETYLMFGFSMENPGLVRSIPLDIPIEGVGSIKVNAKISGRHLGALPPEMDDLKQFFPRVFKKTPKEIEVSSLFIPDAVKPMVLKRILSFLIFLMAPNLAPEVLQNHVALAEFSLITKNQEFYKSLLVFFEENREKYKSTPAFREAVKMAKIQLHEIEEYLEISRKIGKNFGNQASVA